jgi:hypothetical protein
MRLLFTVYEYDPAMPWLIAEITHHMVDLPDAGEFAEWAREQWPSPRYTVELDPGQTTRLMR